MAGGVGGIGGVGMIGGLGGIGGMGGLASAPALGLGAGAGADGQAAGLTVAVPPPGVSVTISKAAAAAAAADPQQAGAANFGVTTGDLSNTGVTLNIDVQAVGLDPLIQSPQGSNDLDKLLASLLLILLMQDQNQG